MSNPVVFDTYNSIYNVYMDSKHYRSSPDRTQAEAAFEEARQRAVDRVTLTREELKDQYYNEQGKIER